MATTEAKQILLEALAVASETAADDECLRCGRLFGFPDASRAMCDWCERQSADHGTIAAVY